MSYIKRNKDRRTLQSHDGLHSSKMEGNQLSRSDRSITGIAHRNIKPIPKWSSSVNLWRNWNLLKLILSTNYPKNLLPCNNTWGNDFEYLLDIWFLFKTLTTFERPIYDGQKNSNIYQKPIITSIPKQTFTPNSQFCFKYSYFYIWF